MKACWLVVLLLATTTMYGQNDTLELSGIYKGKNLYIQTVHPGKGLCIIAIKVNGYIDGASHHPASAIEIDFSSYNLKHGDTVKVSFEHKANCVPKVLNPWAIGAYLPIHSDSITFNKRLRQDIYIASTKKKGATIKVRDENGEVLLQQVLNQGENKVVIAALPNGVYRIEVAEKYRIVMRDRFIKK